MLDSAAVNQIETTVSALVRQRKAFSAFDVTSAVKKILGANDASGNKLLHNDMKTTVHRMFDRSAMDDYGQTLVRYPGAPREAFLYHPPEIDPADSALLNGNGEYVGQQDASASAPALNAPANDGDADDDDSAASGGTATATATRTAATGRATTRKNPDGSLIKTLGNLPGSCLYLPKDWAATIGIPVNGPAFIEIDSTDNKISIKASGSKTACVDKNRNVRIGKTALLSAGIDGDVHIKLDGKEILISKV